ncbi:hypothetical protein [Vibrio hyugaensis]|uniref:hypothetical protein n=1 Tax=Vibrio hyugaensis TaxID=1534743 RepID=UPI0015E27C2C|nr:hypothetical protein [Vibrio hyugaensis]
MKKFTLLAPLFLMGCGGLAIMDRTDVVKAQPEMLVKTDGDFWGFGADGQFDFAGKYKGKYSRSASNSSWFNSVSFKEGAMGAEVTRVDNGETWLLSCTGGGMSINYMGVDFGGNDPYTCQITQDGVKVGEFAMEPKSALIDISLEKKETGVVRVGNTHFNVETVHTSPDSVMAVDIPLGYSFKQGTQEIAAVQTNGTIAVQMLPKLNNKQKDVVAIGAIASALSWRPEE